MIEFQPRFAPLAAMVLAALLTACGGGDGSSPSGQPTQSSQPAAATPSPGLTLLAGTVTPGHASVDGSGANARFYLITALAADSTGAVYVADQDPVTQNPAIRKVSADGTVSTLNADWSKLAGSGIYSISIAADGGVYFTDAKAVPFIPHVNHFINGFHKLGADGSISNLGVTGERDVPLGIVASRDGTLHVYDRSAIYTLAADGSQQLLAGGGSGGDVDGAGGAARFDFLKRVLAGQDGSLYALDNEGLRKVSKTGTVTTLAELGTAVILDLGLDKQDNPLLLVSGTAPSYAYQVSKYTGGALTTLYTVGSPNGTDQQAANALVAMPDGAVVTTDGSGLTRIATDGKPTELAGLRDDSADRAADGTGAQARYVAPAMLAADHDGNIYSVEAGGSGMPVTIRKTTPAGVVTTFAASSQLGLGAEITGMQVTSANALVVSVASDMAFGGRLYKVDQGSVLTPIAGSDFYSAPVQQKDGQGSAAVFGLPSLVGADKDGNLYATDIAEANTTKTTIRKITSQGVVSTVGSLPAGLGAAADGNVYKINDTGSGVLRVAPDGTQTLVAGGDTSSYTNLPGALPAKLYHARSIVPLHDHVFGLAAGNGIYLLVLP